MLCFGVFIGTWIKEATADQRRSGKDLIEKSRRVMSNVSTNCIQVNMFQVKIIVADSHQFSLEL